MTRPQADEQEDKPLDPAVESVRRKLVRFMAVNLGLLFLALMVVGAAQTGDIVLPVGARIVSQSLSGSRIAIDAELADGGREIFVYDMAAQRIIGRYAVRNR